MTSRVQESPFRETEWDQRLDRMLDDLKTTVGGEAELISPDVRSDSTLVSSFRAHTPLDDRPDVNFLEIFRSTSRNEGRSSSRGGSRSGSALGGGGVGVEDGGHMKHSRREYRSPDSNTHVVTEKYEYDTGDSSKTNHYQKKVIKSTYSTFNSMSAGSLEDPPHLTKGPESPPQHSQPINTKVISASQKVANRLVDALATIGGEEGYVPTVDSSDTDTLATDTMKTSKTVGSDYSTLGRLRKNINELDSLIDSLDESEQQQQQHHNAEPPPPVEVLNSAPPEPFENIEHDVPLVLEASELPPDDDEEIPGHAVTDDPSVVLTLAAAEAHSRTVSSTTQICTHSHAGGTTVQQHPVVNRSTAPSNTMANGSLRSTDSSKYDPVYSGDDEMIDDSKSGEVRRIVWRNRFEKTYETQDSSKPPVVSIEDEARRRQLLQKQHITSTSTSTSTLSSPPQVSPGGQSWKEPIPLPTPPQLSPREPGVAYIYTYGNTSGTGVQPLPPLNYVSVPGPSSVPPSEGAPSPTPSQLQGQPIIYHYSYHYTIQPGQPLPDGAPPPPPGMVLPGSPPALQVAPSSQPLPSQPAQPVTTHLTQTSQPVRPSQPAHPSHPAHPGHPAQPTQPDQPSTVVNYSLHKHTTRTSTSTVNQRDTTNIIHPGGYPGGVGPGGPGSPHSPGSPHGPSGPHSPAEPYGSISPKDKDGPDSPNYPSKPHGPDYGPGSPNGPTDPGQGHPGSISITVNKTTTRTTHHAGYPGEPGRPYSPSDVPPVTSTPYPSRGRSVSPERPPVTNAPHHITYVTNIRSTHSDSLERVRRPRNDTLPFPDTSPIKPGGDGKIPRRVDDLMTSFSDSEHYIRSSVNEMTLRKHSPIPRKDKDGPGNGPTPRGPRRDPADEEPLLPQNNQIAVRAEADAKAAAEATPKRELTKNKAGPPVYYPPGHELFHETMHTMTLKESGRRGKAKWRMERASGYKESSSHSETKGGMTMVPVCLPLCCGAACVVM
ncbi:mucin-2-like isoform X2 [Macrobrachium nipponense]|uniref:mucin-2-like isoform X2 n=1 Tax=Macrobrachium nipponense TaxID=159736 RepID=UPI0030C7DC93